MPAGALEAHEALSIIRSSYSGSVFSFDGGTGTSVRDPNALPMLAENAWATAFISRTLYFQLGVPLYLIGRLKFAITPFVALWAKPFRAE